VGLKSLSRDTWIERPQPGPCPEKSLAVAILRQAWHEAIIDLCLVKETTREDYSLLKQKAIDWICSDEDGFVYWCQLADIDHTRLRQKLSTTLHI
jgi:hypothetical protein